jgi:hypothetical protein
MSGKKLVQKMRRIAKSRPEVRRPSLRFIRLWAFGNAGLENPSITDEQVKRVITSIKRSA